MEKMKELYENTEMTLQQIADELGISFSTILRYIHKEYSSEYQLERKRKTYRNSKLGNKNPQKGMTGEKAHQYIGDVSDGKGYLMRLKPNWYTGRKGCKHVFVHHLVICEALGLTEIPKGWCVHHVDEDKTNNDLVNLAFMTTSAHMRLHQLEGATTRAKARRVQEDSKRLGNVEETGIS